MRVSAKTCQLFFLLFCSLILGNPLDSGKLCHAQPEADTRAANIRSRYTKFEYLVPMRDGTKLFTCVYVPNDAIATKAYPILLQRTPYSVGPYGSDQFKTRLGPNEAFEKSGYIFAFQDVRGCYMSEGAFVNMRPQRATATDVKFDESTDSYDTIEWLVNNIDSNNKRVGQWGISYPGFYTAAATIDSHPALKCASPQAPIADWFWDDMHRNGAFNLQLAFTFFSSFGRDRPEPTAKRGERLDIGTDDAYQFFLELGSLKHINERYFHDEIAFWNDLQQHPNYDAFWQSRNLLPHLKNVNCATLVVGGFFDTEDLYGPLEIYRSIEKQNPSTKNNIVMGPWYHGGWNRDSGSQLGDARFDWPTAQWYRDQVEFPFFESYLKGDGDIQLAEATMFETGANRWRTFDAWPPKQSLPKSLYLQPDGQLGWTAPTDTEAADRYISDPQKPVPYTTEISGRWSKDYMAEDQRFAARRPDVLVYRSEVLAQDVTLSGEMLADMWFSTSGSDADLVVKLVDEFPGRPLDGSDSASTTFQSGRQQLVRGQVMRLRYRESFEEPKPLTPDEPTNIQFTLQDVLHTFKRGHRIMIQVQSSWFPFVDRNPQKFVENIFDADDSDFVTATHSIYLNDKLPSRLQVRVLQP